MRGTMDQGRTEYPKMKPASDYQQPKEEGDKEFQKPSSLRLSKRDCGR